MNSILKSIRRSWRHHFVTQVSTLIVLCGAFSVIVGTVLISQNLSHVLSSWGESLQVTAYLEEGLEPSLIDSLSHQLKKIGEVVKIEFIDREQATAHFKEQMASYAPGLLTDADFANPFPASFRLTLKEGSAPEKLRNVSDKIQGFEGIEEVSYGQTWISNYSVFSTVISRLGQVLMVLLVAGGAMIVGNAIRASVAVRKEDVEILELVGATKSMIRTPFLVEGAFLGLVAASFSLIVNFALYAFAIDFLSRHLTFMRFAEVLTFVHPLMILFILLLGTVVGFLGAYLAVRSLNDGWSASKRGHTR